MPLDLSIVISSFNYARYLAAAIDSALAQEAAEVLVVDDGSTDGSRDVLARYAGRITSILKENGGQASALNAGFSRSRGSAVLFMDSDDVLLPGAARAAIKALDDPAVAKVHWPAWIIDEHGERTGQLQRPVLDEGNLKATIAACGPYGYHWPPTTQNAWPRRVLECLMPVPEPEYRTCPDLHLCALAPLYGRVARIDRPISCWRMHPQNNSSRDTFDRRLREGLARDERCMASLVEHCLRAGIEPHRKDWPARSWWHQIDACVRELTAVVPHGARLILVNEDLWACGPQIAGRPISHFMDAEGRYAGRPLDDSAAIAETHRLREAGAAWLAVAWPCLWWLENYPAWTKFLETEFRMVSRSDRVAIYDLGRR